MESEVNFDSIDTYLWHLMSDEERQNFEKNLATDEALRAELALRQLENEAFQLADKTQLRAKMKAYWTVIDPATERVLLIVIAELIVASTVADVPPNGMTQAMPAAGALVNGAVVKMPVPIQVELAPAAPIVRNTRLNSRCHGTAVMLIGIVTVWLVPNVVPPRTPYCGIRIIVPDAPVERMPPALIV